MLPKDTFTQYSSPKMVLTSYEFCANIGFTNSCDITIQAQQKSQVDYFNTTVLNSRRPESCTQWSESNEISTKPVSQISSNGYYGFTYINKNVDMMAAAENGNDVNTHTGKGETKTHKDLDNNSLNQIEKFSFNITSIPQPKKRIRPNENCANKLEINAKRCRLERETDKLPVIEPLSKMEVDIIEVDKDANNLYEAANIHRMFTQPPCPSNNPKNNFEKSASYGLMPGQTQINARLSALRCNKNPETHGTPYRSESICSRINKGAGTSKEISCNDKNKRQLEQMFSETHGSGLFYLDLDEGSFK